MLTGRQKIWSALHGQTQEKPPKGELLIESSLIEKFSCPDLEFILNYLGADLVTFHLNDISQPWKYWQQKDYFIFGIFQGPFTLMIEKLGWMEGLHLLKKNPGEVRTIMENMAAEQALIAARALDEGCDGIILADDLAGSQGLMISPVFLNNYYFPILNKLLEKLDGKHVPFVFHSDGNIMDLVSPLKNTGFWGIQSLQPSAGIGPEKFLEEIYHDWLFWGNFEFEGLDRMKTVSEIETDVKNLLKAWSNFPGYVFGSSGGLYNGLSPEMIKAAYDTADKFHR